MAVPIFGIVISGFQEAMQSRGRSRHAIKPQRERLIDSQGAVHKPSHETPSGRALGGCQPLTTERRDRMAGWRRAAAALAAFFLMSTASAQTFPTRTVKVVVPAAPGGSMDVLARILTPGLNEKWGQPVIIENRPGGAGNIAASVVAKADPDGYTLLVWNDTLLINPHLFKEVPYDARHDFTPLSLSIFVPNVLAVHPSTGLRGFAEFLEEAKARPGRLSYGSPGNGSPGHLSFELLRQLTGIDVVHVPYRGAGPAIADLVAGQIPIGMIAVPGAIGHIKAGGLTALAVTSSQRVQALPDVPTVAEAIAGDYPINAWHGILGPAGMAPALAAQIERDVTEVLDRPAVRTRLVELGFEPASAPGAKLAEVIAREFPVWRAIVARSGAKAE
jgi:tripartite-type tricarboxylate transporter receptor subunit TctC